LIPIKPLNKTPKSKEAAKEAKRRVPSVAFFVRKKAGFEKKSGNAPTAAIAASKKKDGKKKGAK
jgi:hypothetical protein